MNKTFHPTTLFAALVAALCMAAAGSIPALAAGNMGVVSITLPAETAQFKPGPGIEYAWKNCMTCHSADYVYMQPPLSEERWHGVVMKMKKVMGADIPDGDIGPLAKYLATTNGPK
jgi:hypothetical protein